MAELWEEKGCYRCYGELDELSNYDSKREMRKWKKGGGEEKGVLAILEIYLCCLVLLEMYFQSLDLSHLFQPATFQVLPIQNWLCKTKDSIKNSTFVQQVLHRGQ